MKTSTRWVTICFIALHFFVPLFVLTQETGGNSQEISKLNSQIKDRQSKIKQIEESIVATKKKIDQTRTQAQSLKNQISYLDNRSALIAEDIELTAAKLDVLTIEINVLTLSISDKESSIKRQQKMIGELIRTIYYEKDKGYLEIAASYNNFSDFYTRLQYLQTIEGDLGNVARGLRLAKIDLDERRTIAQTRKESYEELKDKLDEQKKDLEEQTFVKETLLTQTRASELTYQSLLANLRKQAESIENEISSIEKEVRRRLEEEDKLRSLEVTDPNTLSWPAPSRYITAYFRDPSYPYRHIFEHSAIDIRASQGTPIRAAASGYVGRAKICGSASCYSYVMIVHSGGLSTVYGHLSKVSVEGDQFVARGDIIGYSGGTPGTVGAGPFVTGPHLHFEVRKDGIPVNPLGYLVRE